MISLWYCIHVLVPALLCMLQHISCCSSGFTAEREWSEIDKMIIVCTFSEGRRMHSEQESIYIYCEILEIYLYWVASHGLKNKRYFSPSFVVVSPRPFNIPVHFKPLSPSSPSPALSPHTPSPASHSDLKRWPNLTFCRAGGRGAQDPGRVPRG